MITSKKLLFSMITTAFLFTSTKAQMPENYRASVELQATGTTSGVVPFWFRSNQFGSIPLSGLSGSAVGRISKSYSEPTPNEDLYSKQKLIDWGFGFESRANGGKNANFQLIEAYAKGKLSIFQLKIGRSKDVMGLNGDTSLSSGNFAVSGNALGVPKIEISIPNYWRLPMFDGLFSIKGNFNHGWLGKVRILDSVPIAPPNKTLHYVKDNMPNTYFHQKSFYVRLGREDWKLNLYGGFNHQVFWGQEKDTYGSYWKLSDIESFFRVVTGLAYGGRGTGLERSKIGNHGGSIDIGADYDFGDTKIKLYRQNFYDVGALSKLANLRDGLTGITVNNNNFDNHDSGFMWKAILLEFFYSKDQAGYPWSKATASGDEDYYNNYYYYDGYSYKKQGLGNPLITTYLDSKPGQASRPRDYFINNRVIAIHAGFTGNLNAIDFTTKISYSWNYGTFGTSKYGRSLGETHVPQTENLFHPVNQLSIYFDGTKNLHNGSYVGVSAALDKGRLLNNSFGISLKYKKDL